MGLTLKIISVVNLESSAELNRSISTTRTASQSHHTFDVVIIGLTVARQFLMGSGLTVAVVDKAVPCSGATGAGQEYLWMVHKTPGRLIWGLAIRNDRLGMMLAERLCEQGLDPLQHLGWNNNKGSILIGRSHGELGALKGRVTLLRHAGLRAEYLSGGELLLKEPDLLVDEDSVAAFVPGDCQ